MLGRKRDIQQVAEKSAPAAVRPAPGGSAGRDSTVKATERERRLQMQAYHAWASIARHKAFPTVEDMRAVGAAAFRNHSFLIDLSAGPLEPKLSDVGSELLFDCDEPPRSPDSIPSLSILSRLTDHYLQAVSNRAPIGFEAAFDNRLGQHLQYRGILLPLSSDGETIDSVWGVINWREQAGVKPSSQSPVMKKSRSSKTPAAEQAPEAPPVQQLSKQAEKFKEYLMSVENKLNECMEIEGAMAAALVDSSSGMAVATVGSPRGLDLNVAAAGNTNVMRAKYSTMAELGLKEEIEDVLITLGSQYHMIRPLSDESGKGLFVYLVLDKAKANLAMARFKLGKIEKELTV